MHWRDKWRITGAFAFITAEANLIDQAKSLGIYDSLARVELTDDHAQTLLYKREKLIRQRSFSIADILLNEAIPAREKAALAVAFPRLARQLLRNDPRNLASAAALDTETACAWFRKVSPAFVDYYLEPHMQSFCGYGENDYSIAWLAWVMSGFQWANGWWSFAERGVGQLTHSMEVALSQDTGTKLMLATEVRRVVSGADCVNLSFEQGGRLHQERFDAAIFAVPGHMVAHLIADLDETRRTFFENVSYVGHHIVNFIVRPSMPLQAFKRLLPTADGFEVISNLVAETRSDGLFEVYGEIKGAHCAATAGASSETILGNAWNDACNAAPELKSAEIIDALMLRNDVAIARRPVGYVRSLKSFLEMPSVKNLAFAGDYLLNSTVGQAHWTGLLAAEAIHHQAHA